MNQLKSAIADKVLEISTSDSGEIKTKLEKINRFRDFTDACQVLIQKYPDIETEFLRMIENNDFDARVAASRVDTIIRLSETDKTQKRNSEETSIEQDITQLDEIIECIPNQEILTTVTNSIENINKTIPVEQTPLIEQTDVKNLLENTDQADPVINLEEEYVDFEEISDNEQKEKYLESKPLSQDACQGIESKIKTDNHSKKETIKKVLLILGIVAAVIILIFVIKFVINNWQILLWILGGCIVAAGVVCFLLKQSKERQN